MSFTDSQLRKLRARLNPDRVRSRVADGQILSYLEGWDVIAEANRIFGFDSWDRETLASTCVYAKQLGDKYSSAYTARVRVTVRAGDQVIIREGCGAGEATVTSPGQAHEVAAKAAETDATKRALITFGNAFGLSLYRGIVDPAERATKPVASLTGPKRVDEQIRRPGQTVPGLLVQSGPVEVTAQPGGARSHQSEEPAHGEELAQAFTPDPGSIPAIPPHDPQRVSDLRLAGPVRVPPPVDKSVLTISEPRRFRDPAHLRFVASHPCMVCGRSPAQAHHLKFTQSPAMSRKVSDEYTVPLCALHHRELHDAGHELGWWERRKLDPVPVALALWTQSRSGQTGTRTGVGEEPLNGTLNGW